MKNLTVKTIGAGPNYPLDSVEISAQEIADAIQANISGGKATEMQADQLTQEFVDQFEIKARYASGTFLSFKISDEAEDEFDTFKKR